MPSRAFAATIRYLAALPDRIMSRPRRRPTIEAQSEAGDCGYVCISAVMALLGRPMLVEDIKALAGTTARGLTLRQVRDGLRACGVEAEAISFDCTQAGSFPCM